jgi:thioredoxin 1
VQTLTLEVTDRNFEQVVLHSLRPVTLLFGADWSGSTCIMQTIIAEHADELDEIVTCARIDFARHAPVAARFGVTSVPTILIFSAGHVTDMIVGMVSYSELTDRIQTALKRED